MAEVTVTQFAEVLKVPVDRLLTQLGERASRSAALTTSSAKRPRWSS